MHVGLGGILGSTNRTLDMGQLVVLLLLHLLYLHLLNVLSDLFCEQVPQLVPYLMPRIKLLGQLVRVVSLANEDILAASLANFYCQGQDLLLRGR